MGPKIECIVVDTTAFIKNAPLHDISSDIITIQEVVDEITNKRQIRRLVVFPYDLQLKEVFQENIQFITEFSKKTGDYPSLSSTDIKVMALTYQLEKEKVGTDHLNTNPEMKKEFTFASHLPEGSESTAGFYFPSRKVNGEGEEGEEEEEEDDDDDEEEKNHEVKESLESEVKDIVDRLNALDCTKSDENMNMDKILVPVKEDTGEVENKPNNDLNSGGEDDYSSSSSDDDNDGWITPQNIAHKRQEIIFEEENSEPVKVACITSDFAMQNVLKQIGLNVVSSDGHVIQHLRSFILRCYACFKTTSIMTKIFCPNCGNKTLKKVAVSLNEDGTQIIHLSKRVRITGRGKKFSLPMPKGGKHANNPILCEDQRMPQQRPTRLARMKNNPLDPDYIAGFSPFVMRDVTSKSAMLGIRSGTDIKSLMRRDVRKKGKKK